MLRHPSRRLQVVRFLGAERNHVMQCNEGYQDHEYSRPARKVPEKKHCRDGQEGHGEQIQEADITRIDEALLNKEDHQDTEVRQPAPGKGLQLSPIVTQAAPACAVQQLSLIHI